MADDGIADDAVKLRPCEAVGTGERVNLADGVFIINGIDKGAGDIIDEDGLKQARALLAKQASAEIGHE